MFTKLADDITELSKQKITFQLHLLYAAIDGIVLGLLQLNEFVFVKSIGGSPFQLSLLFQFSLLVFLIEIFLGRFFTSARKIRLTLRTVALITRLPMLLFLLIPSSSFQTPSYQFFFLSVFLLYYLADPFILPSINYYLKNNYQEHNFGRLYSVATSVNKIIMMIMTFLYGVWLDAHPDIFRFVLPAGAILSIISLFLLTSIQKHDLPSDKLFPKHSGSLKHFFEILFKNRPFLIFQIAFMIYGFAYMIGLPPMNLFYRDVLELNYTSVAFYKNIFNVVAIILLPFMGRLLDVMKPILFARLSFMSLLFFFVFVILAGQYPYYTDVSSIRLFYFMFVAVLFYGVFAATMSLLWHIGSAYFAGKQDVGIYQAVHLFLTGVRAIPAPVLGIFVYQEFGYLACFLLSILLLVPAMLIVRKKYFLSGSIFRTGQ